MRPVCTEQIISVLSITTAACFLARHSDALAVPTSLDFSMYPESSISSTTPLFPMSLLKESTNKQSIAAKFAAKRSGVGSFPVRGNALTSGDSLSDTKIFILLAAIVFVFLAALGVAMARVSRNRRRNYSENVTQHIISAQRQPETLNKTILDLLPVFEVTEKHRLRQLQLRSPRPAALRDCFIDNGSEHSLQIMPSIYRRESSAPDPIDPVDFPTIKSGGYRLDSRVNTRRSLSMCSGQQISEGEMHCSNHMPEMSPTAGSNSHPMDGCVQPQTSGSSKKPDHCTPLSQQSSSATPPFALDTPPPAAIRYYRSIPSQDATPSGPTRCPSAGVNWDDAMLGYGRDNYINTGTVVYQERGSRSLDLSPDYESAALPDHHQNKPLASAWNPCCSQPEIARKHSRSQSMATSGCESGLGSCPICLEEFEAGEHLRELPCFHRYHVICIDTWLVSRSTCCPYCKLDIRRWYYGPAFEDGAPHVGSIEHQGLPLDFHDQDMAGSSSSSGLAAQDSGGRRHRRSNRLHRRQRRSSRRHRHGHFNGFLQLLRTAMTSDIHYTDRMRPG